MSLMAVSTGAETMSISRIEKFISRLDIDESGCWLWTGGRTSGGYGVTSVEGKSRFVHRVMYELVNGISDLSLQLDHLCRVQNCANPKHLEQVTEKENLRRKNAVQTHCKRGHELSGDNLILEYDRAGDYTKRRCKTCRRMISMQSYYRNKLTLKGDKA